MRVIQIGVGGFGAGWVQRLVGDPAVDLVALVDISDAMLTHARELSGMAPEACFSSLGEALTAVPADLLVCVTPPEHHRQAVCEA